MAELYSSRAIVNILLRHGFIFISQKGSHKKFRKGERTVIVPDPKKEIPLGTFASILRQSGLSKEDFK
ncbi:MAG: type II toxin-antitoxin system HicA family toxin [Nitrosomonadales bacterium]|jgi:predicted RNA binding protein YcfA (HicA-like mRNA interferase family)|nr:type II toxin-antitoxin system HicA family toxin [Nitrosomonadales bacterium]MBL0037729.1 type II toxin-antitoxin system HicA family toxin [Nitrosomonadales bacterium]